MALLSHMCYLTCSFHRQHPNSSYMFLLNRHMLPIYFHDEVMAYSWFVFTAFPPRFVYDEQKNSSNNTDWDKNHTFPCEWCHQFQAYVIYLYIYFLRQFWNTFCTTLDLFFHFKPRTLFLSHVFSVSERYTEVICSCVKRHLRESNVITAVQDLLITSARRCDEPWGQFARTPKRWKCFAAFRADVNSVE